MRTRFTMLLFPAICFAQPLFEGAAPLPGEDLKGRPKSVRVEREPLTGEKRARVVEDETTFREEGQLASESRYVDGKLISRDLWNYDNHGRRARIETVDESGKIKRIRTFHRLPDGREEEVDFQDGKETSRTTRRFDRHDRVVELRTAERSGETTSMQFDYDGQGRPLAARVTFAGGESLHPGPKPDGIRITFVYPGNDKVLLTLYDGAGEIMLQTETTGDQAGNQVSQVLFEREPHNNPAASMRIDVVDATGNWIAATLFERDPRTQAETPVARRFRTIVYY